MCTTYCHCERKHRRVQTHTRTHALTHAHKHTNMSCAGQPQFPSNKLCCNTFCKPWTHGCKTNKVGNKQIRDGFENKQTNKHWMLFSSTSWHKWAGSLELQHRRKSWKEESEATYSCFHFSAGTSTLFIFLDSYWKSRMHDTQTGGCSQAVLLWFCSAFCCFYNWPPSVSAQGIHKGSSFVLVSKIRIMRLNFEREKIHFPQRLTNV